MSLSTTDALKSAISDLENAKLCLYDAIPEANIREEMEQIGSIIRHLDNELVKLGGEE